MKRKRKIFILLMIPAALLFLTGGCSQKRAETIPDYPGWEKYSYKHFVFHFPKDCFWGKKMDEFSPAYERFLKEDCDFLAIEIPTDTIHFYIHNNPEDGFKLTGRKVPFHTERQIHWDRRTPWGLELARFLIDKMDVRMTDYRFLYDGLSALLDYSGYDYHHNAMSLLEIKRYIPLDSLIDNDSYMRADSLYREWEAASIVGFITYNFGVNRFKMLWQSAATFEESVKQLFGVDLRKFESGWHAFAKQYYKGINIDTTKMEPDKPKTDSTGNQ